MNNMNIFKLFYQLVKKRIIKITKKIIKIIYIIKYNQFNCINLKKICI